MLFSFLYTQFQQKQHNGMKLKCVGLKSDMQWLMKTKTIWKKICLLEQFKSLHFEFNVVMLFQEQVTL